MRRAVYIYILAIPVPVDVSKRNGVTWPFFPMSFAVMSVGHNCYQARPAGLAMLAVVVSVRAEVNRKGLISMMRIASCDFLAPRRSSHMASPRLTL